MERLGEIRSLLPSHVRMLALTATATKSVISSVSLMLGLESPVAIALSPSKANLIYNVGTFFDVEKTFKPLLQCLKADRVVCAQIFLYICHNGWGVQSLNH